jgi:enamine deaminase RidA (YjgF/YER057c/UK114 family)
MTTRHLNPEGLYPPTGYTHVVAVEAVKKLVFVAGQVAVDAEARVVGKGDLRAQTVRAFENLGIALSAAGAKPADIVKTTIFVVGYEPAQRAVIAEVREWFFGGATPPASTLVGVQALAFEGLLVEVEAIAAVG